jgi:2-iminobutanoate/2-iminopropanoate deaminase
MTVKRTAALLISCALLLTISIAAIGAPQNEGPRYLDLPGRTDDLPYSHLVVAGNTVYLSGTIGVDPATNLAHADIDAEIRQVLDNVKERLAHVGLTMDDLVSVQVFCPDLSLYDRFNAIYATYFEENRPARAFIGSGPLLRNGHFEVQGVAVMR